MLTSLAREQLQSLMPHEGRMCLIDRVVSVSNDSITVVSVISLTGHPLTCDDSLSNYVILEYAAQAAALHISNRKESGFKTGVHVFLAAVKNMNCPVETLRDGSALTIELCCLTISELGAMYEFKAGASCWPDNQCMSGRFSLMASNEVDVTE